MSCVNLGSLEENKCQKNQSGSCNKVYEGYYSQYRGERDFDNFGHQLFLPNHHGRKYRIHRQYNKNGDFQKSPGKKSGYGIE